jgi:hypothetical protein
MKIVILSLIFIASGKVFAKNLSDPPKYLTRNYKLNKNFLSDLNASGSRVANRISWDRDINPLQKKEVIYLYMPRIHSDPKLINPEFSEPDYQIQYQQKSKSRIVKMSIEE